MGFLCKAYKDGLLSYNNGSSSSDAAKSFLEYFMGTISTDGYTVYRMYDGEDSKVLHMLKNCMNIGNEDAAENSAFIFSLIESCKLNDIDPQDYLKHLFECILHGKDCDKKTLLPCFYKPEC